MRILRGRKKGIVGVESAIVMIAFVIVAAALAFVVLNMGFFTTQQTRGAIQRGLGEASSALELDGTVVANVSVSEQSIKSWFVTLKLSAGQYKVDLTPVKTIISYWSPERGIALANSYLIAITSPVYDPETVVNITKILLSDDTTTISGSKGEVVTYYVDPKGQNVATSPTDGYLTVKIGLPDDVPNNKAIPLKDFFGNYSNGVVSVIAWVTKANDDTVIDPGEKVLLLVYYKDNSYMPKSYDTIKAEIKVPVGAPLTIERTVPPSLTQAVIDLG